MVNLTENYAGTNQHRNFSDILKSSPVITYIMDIDPAKGCRYVSENIFLLLGYETAEVLDNSIFWINHIHPDDRRYVMDNFKINRDKGGGIIEYRFLADKGNYIWLLDISRISRNDNGSEEIIGTWVDVTERHISQEELNFRESHDELTGLINRKTFEYRLDLLLKKAATDDSDHILCYMDLDQFRIINDTYGHIAGDELLRKLGRYLQNTLSKRDTFAYLGGDEFGILLEGCTLEKAQRVFEILQQSLHDFEFDWQGRKFSVSASIGVISINKNYSSSAELLSMADIACYSAKETGRNQIHVYHGTNGSVASRHREMRWVERIEQAIQEDRFFLYYQPISGLNGNAMNKHFELLLRLKDEDGNIITPGYFLPAAERYYLSEKLDRWVIATTLTWLETYSELIPDNQRIGINLSGQSLASSTLLEFFVHELNQKEVQAESIYIEITESAAIANFKQALNFIETLKDFGCQFALDDFGKGVSSFNYLKMLPVDFLKIEGIFVRDMKRNNTDYVMVKAINEVGKSMGKKTIAECVEHKEILPYLQELKVDYAQGYAIAEPQPLTDFFDNQ